MINKRFIQSLKNRNIVSKENDEFIPLEKSDKESNTYKSFRWFI
ncbi:MULTISPECIES: hypothetical protein [Winogradskyella]|nr:MULTISPECIES: hypothetical protein [Winogradskyella]